MKKIFAIIVICAAMLSGCRQTVSQRQLLVEADSLIEVHEGLQALERLTRAVELADSLRLTALAYSQMGSVYLEQGMDDLALEAFTNALRYDSLSNDTMGIVYDLRDIGNTYRCREKPDSCVIYFNRARTLSAAVGDSLLLSDVESQLAGYYLNLARQRKERNLLDSARHLLLPALATADSENVSGLYFMAADYYSLAGQRDSAEWYYRQLLDKGNVYTQQAAHRALADICMTKSGGTEAALQHLKQYETLTDSVINLNDNEAMRRYNALYNYQLHEREAQRLQAENQRGRLFMALAVIAVVALVLALIARQLYFSRRQLEYRLRIEQLEQLLARQKTIGSAEAEARLNQVKQAPVYGDIMHAIEEQEGSTLLKAEQWKALEQVINEAYPGFNDRLYSFCRLNNFEYQVCLLLKTGIAPTHIAYLTAHSKQSVATTRSRLYQKAFGLKGAAHDWDEVVQSL